MVNNHIRVYARIKKETDGHKARYDVITDENHYDIMKIYNSGNSFKRKRRAFRFNKVFDEISTQEDIFNVIAKPIIHDVFEGLNATIFAYGATGSGKTYTLTGSQSKYNERGLIPRTIEYIFKLVTNNMSNYMFFISYLEIYNENAYDLLNPKQNFTCLEELPRVIVLEDEKGEAHFKNLCLKEVNTEKEAMRLLYSGDNNRTIAETPLNDYSSRSHCVFTVHVISKCHTSGNITRSKLNLVDLAGSERLHRMNLHGMTLNEARHINLSLHYLERVIQALSHKGRSHVPYRNSMMTFILRDSLGGNCLTAMLATLSMLHLNIEETISTCKFAQRVCLIKLDANVNFVPTPEKEIHYLRNELKRLRRQINEKLSAQDRKLTSAEEDECKFAVKQYLLGKDELKLDDVRKVKFYIDCMRDKLLKRGEGDDPTMKGNVKSIEEIERKYQQLIEQKDEEINILMSVYDTETLFKPISTESIFNDNRMDPLEKEDFKKYFARSQLKNHYDNCTKQIKGKYHEAVKISQIISAKQKQIANMKRSMAKSESPSVDLKLKLSLDQSFYREQLRKMHNIKGDIEDLKINMNKIKLKILDEYKTWCFINGDRKSLIVEKTVEVPPNDFDYSFLANSEMDRIATKNNLVSLETNGFRSPKLRKVIVNYNIPTITTTGELPIAECKVPPVQTHSCDAMVQTALRNVCSLGHLPDTKTCLTSCEKSLKVPASPNSCSPHFCTFGCTSTIDVENEAPHAGIGTQMSRISSASHVSSEASPHFSLLQCKSADYISIRNSECNRPGHPESARRHLRPSYHKFIKPDDSPEFVLYLKSIPLTGDDEVDDEIIKFYRLKHKRREIKSLVRK